MIDNHAAYKYETPYKGSFVIMKCCTHGTVALQCFAIKIRYNICPIKPHTSDTNVDYLNVENNY